MELSRRTFLKQGVAGALLLGTGGVAGASELLSPSAATEKPAAKNPFHLGMAGYTFVNFDLETTLKTLKRLDIAGYFSQVIFVQELGLLKKDPETYGKVLAPLGAAPADCTFYEDSPGACAAAKAAGLTVVGVYDPFYAHYEGQLRELCHRYIRSFTELL